MGGCFNGRTSERRLVYGNCSVYKHHDSNRSDVVCDVLDVQNVQVNKRQQYKEVTAWAGGHCFTDI